jgi:hypothetical protein
MKIVCALPGQNYSATFLRYWTEFLSESTKRGWGITLSQRSGADIYALRSACLCGDIRRGEDQKPFNGEVDYDYVLWIDSDIIFKAEDVESLINRDLDVVTGLYSRGDGCSFCAIEALNQEYFEKHGHYEWLTPNSIKEKTLIPIECCGFGFLLVKKGVFEKLNYPWFEQRTLRVGNIADFYSEDISCCLRMKEAGIKLFADATVRVGHEKLSIL